MNLFIDYQKRVFKLLIKLSKDKVLLLPDHLKSLTIEIPPKDQDSHISCNAAMILAKHNKIDPIELAKILEKKFLENFSEFEKVEVAKPGFLNISFKQDFWKNYLLNIIKLSNDYGSTNEEKRKFNVEFVSANPTGPLHVGHCRGAIIGDVISNLLIFNGNSVTKEYYVNDYGGQIKNFISSVYYRILELKEKKPFPANGDLYPGDYIIHIAKNIIENNDIKNFKNFENIYEKLSSEALSQSIKMIKANLKILGIKHDNFIYESNLVKNKLVDSTVRFLKEKNYVYSGRLEAPKGEDLKNWKIKDKLLFKSTMFGDDVDRALQKNDLTWTYFAGDLAYHANKLNRKYDVLVNILGADHSGYIKRIVAAVKALSNNKVNLVCKVSQLVKLFKNGVPFKMSKRKGDYITVEDLVNEIGKDSVRFMMLNRSNDVELEFDFKQVSDKSKENPVFYVQYAYARINSVFRALNQELSDEIILNVDDIALNDNEIKILKKISEWPRCIQIASTKLEPHRIPFFLYDLATLFHAYWNLGNTNKEFRFTIDNKNIQKSRLLLLKALSIVINNGMTILGVSTPKSM